MKVKLQPPSGSDLVAYNPLTPPSSISQILLLANPTKVSSLSSPHCSYIVLLFICLNEYMPFFNECLLWSYLFFVICFSLFCYSLYTMFRLQLG